MFLDFATLPKAEVYRLLTHTVAPRPIAWVLTAQDAQAEPGGYNLAPFSYFTIVSSDPAVLMIAVGHKRDGSEKDTWVNIERDRQAVVHVATADLVDAVNESARTLPHGESELQHLSLTLASQAPFRLPRIAQAPVAYNCTLQAIHRLGNGPQAVIYLNVESAQIADGLLDTATMTVDTQALNPLSRLGGQDYALLGERLTRVRPQ